MKQLAFAIFLVLGPVLISGILSCNQCNPSPYRFGIQDYKVYPRKITVQGYKSYLADTLADGEAVSYREVELILIGHEIVLASKKRMSFGTNLMACDPAVIAVDKIRKIVVTSNQNYSTDFPSGSNLAPLLTIGTNSYDQKPLTDFLISESPFAQSFLTMRFTKAPGLTVPHQLSINIDLGKGNLITYITRPIVIKP